MISAVPGSYAEQSATMSNDTVMYLVIKQITKYSECRRYTPAVPLFGDGSTPWPTVARNGKPVRPGQQNIKQPHRPEGQKRLCHWTHCNAQTKVECVTSPSKRFFKFLVKQ